MEIPEPIGTRVVHTNLREKTLSYSMSPPQDRRNLNIVHFVLAGRLTGYLLFGIAAGLLGQRFATGQLALATDISLILLSIVLIFYLLGLVKEKGIFCLSSKFFKSKSPFLMGLLMGINLCPPFLLSVITVFSGQNAFYGAVYFFLFFLASSIYFLPMVFLSLLSKAREFQLAARVSGFAAAGIFLVYGFYSLLHNHLRML